MVFRECIIYSVPGYKPNLEIKKKLKPSTQPTNTLQKSHGMHCDLQYYFPSIKLKDEGDAFYVVKLTSQGKNCLKIIEYHLSHLSCNLLDSFIIDV